MLEYARYTNTYYNAHTIIIIYPARYRPCTSTLLEGRRLLEYCHQWRASLQRPRYLFDVAVFKYFTISLRARRSCHPRQDKKN